MPIKIYQSITSDLNANGSPEFGTITSHLIFILVAQVEAGLGLFILKSNTSSNFTGDVW